MRSARRAIGGGRAEECRRARVTFIHPKFYPANRSNKLRAGKASPGVRPRRGAPACTGSRAARGRAGRTCCARSRRARSAAPRGAGGGVLVRVAVLERPGAPPQVVCMYLKFFTCQGQAQFGWCVSLCAWLCLDTRSFTTSGLHALGFWHLLRPASRRTIAKVVNTADCLMGLTLYWLVA